MENINPNNDCKDAHLHSLTNREEILSSEICGCYYCLETYPPDEIFKWTDRDENGLGQTAICPYCEVDSVIGSASGKKVNKEFLKEMHEKWF